MVGGESVCPHNLSGEAMSREQPDGEESCIRDQSAEGARFVRIATLIYIAVLVLSNLALVVSVMATHYRVVGRSGVGMVMLVNLAVPFLGSLSYLLIERFSRGASWGIYAAAIW